MICCLCNPTLSAYECTKSTTSYRIVLCAIVSCGAVNFVMNTGYVPKTQLYRNTSRVQRVFNVVCFHYLLHCFRLSQNVRDAALQIVNLAISEKYEGNQLVSLSAQSLLYIYMQ